MAFCGLYGDSQLVGKSPDFVETPTSSETEPSFLRINSVTKCENTLSNYLQWSVE